MIMKHRVIAINLPQFHPFPENDEWWGKGFTEWTNVTKAQPRFKGHYQPHFPTDTGFYDLRLPEARQMQADMARESGIYGFCYYHYWFNGKQLMERPVNEILKSGKPDFPFMLCWANENWSRNWDGGFSKVLIEQNYSDDDDIAHIRWLCKNVFSDKRYIRVEGRPVYAIYRIDLFPNIKKTIDNWRRIATDEFGMDLYLMNVEFLDSTRGKNALIKGFDASLDFQPISVYKTPLNRVHKHFRLVFLLSKIPFVRSRKIVSRFLSKLPDIYYYEEYVNYCINQPFPDYKWYPCVSPGFDNSPRRENNKCLIFVGSTPILFGRWLRSTLKKFVPYSEYENFVFINAWNEWAEGNHLEPDRKWGRAYLEETRRCVDDDNVSTVGSI